MAMVPSLGQAAFLGHIWLNEAASGGNASIVPARAADAAFFTNVIDYDSRLTGYTPAGFLKNPTFFDTSLTWDPNQTFNNSFIQFTGAMYLEAGTNSFAVPHDDGVTLFINGIGLVLNEPGPTAPIVSPFDVTVATAGVYNFTLNYGECCGPPAVLRFTVNGEPPNPVPEPATLLLLGMGLAGAVGARRRRR